MNNNYYLSVLGNKKKQEIAKIIKSNEYTSKYGLKLTEEQINNIIERRFETLKDTGRLEFGDWIIDKIIKEFCNSPYISNQNYGETIYELIDIFYYYKNETNDLVTDDELLKFMKEHFDGIAQGSLDYLAGTVLDRMAENVLEGKPMDYLVNRESPQGYEEDE
jgi:hypothetical protein